MNVQQNSGRMPISTCRSVFISLNSSVEHDDISHQLWLCVHEFDISLDLCCSVERKERVEILEHSSAVLREDRQMLRELYLDTSIRFLNMASNYITVHLYRSLAVLFFMSTSVSLDFLCLFYLSNECFLYFTLHISQTAFNYYTHPQWRHCSKN